MKRKNIYIIIVLIVENLIKKDTIVLLIPHHNSGGILWYHVGCLCVHLFIHPSVMRPSIFSFPDDILSKYQWIFTKLL